MPNCNSCQEPIIFDDYHISASGKHIPLDAYSGEPHKCPNKACSHSADDEYEPETKMCYGCQAEIYFDDQHISATGKHIPLDKKSGQPHQCPAKPFHRLNKQQ